jgi:sirohydrochlorin cobaltochelatase
MTAAKTEAQADLDALDAKINALLPPRYQGCFNDVPTGSMGTAGLKYDEHGQVAWNEIWTSFCHLALAGGPPHRGTLLRPVPADEIAAHPDAQKKVLAELDRGIRMTTWLATARSATPGWIGIRCYDEDMSGWLQRAIVAENLSARRERNVLLLPAGPGFRIEKEIKNVITCVAKTCHYLLDHVSAGARPAGLGRSLIEPPTLAEMAAQPDVHRRAAETTARTIAETTGMPPRLSTPGWVDFDCGDEDMAVWLLRAIVVEDVLVRRETAFVCVPAKPESAKAVAEAHRLWRLKMA